MSFNDKLSVSDGVAIALNCGRCNQPAVEPHICMRRMLREARVVRVRALLESIPPNPSDPFSVQVEKGGEEYTTTRAVIERDYKEL